MSADIANLDLPVGVLRQLAAAPHRLLFFVGATNVLLAMSMWTLWLVGDADVLLVGSTEPLNGRIGGMAHAMQRPGVADDLASIGVTGPFSITSLFVAEGETLKAWASDAPLQTDDRSALEFSGPRSVFATARDDNATALRELAAKSPKPAAVTNAQGPANRTRPRSRAAAPASSFAPAAGSASASLRSLPPPGA